jgi:hypothetical protein
VCSAKVQCVLVCVRVWVCVGCVGSKFKISPLALFFARKLKTPPRLLLMSRCRLDLFRSFLIFKSIILIWLGCDLSCAVLPSLPCCAALCCSLLCSVLWARRSTSQRALNTQHCSAMLVFSDRCRTQLTEMQ